MMGSYEREENGNEDRKAKRYSKGRIHGSRGKLEQDTREPCDLQIRLLMNGVRATIIPVRT